MRPLRLELEGFTSFKERLALDFDGLDLFAITGPTGAGKSSLIDALVFALYGQVPRVGREYKQLVSHGAERLSVGLDFEVGGKRYRVARTVRVAGNPQVVLERQADGGFEPLAGRVKEIEEAIEKIVGLDYDAFTRSVVLPQGQFDAFLKGEPKERRKILVALLNLGVYEDMQQIASRRALDARREAEFIANQLAGDFKDASPTALEVAQRSWPRRASGASRPKRALAGLAEALAAAQRVATARRDLEAHRPRPRRRAEREPQKAAATLAEAGAGATRSRASRRRSGDGSRPSGSTPSAMKPSWPRSRGPSSSATWCPGASASRRRGPIWRRGGLAARARLAEAESGGAAPGAAAHRAAQARSKAREPSAKRLHRRHAALELRRHLEPGEPCPVCEQVVRTVPRGRGRGPGRGRRRGQEGRGEARPRRARSLERGRIGPSGARGEVGQLEAEAAQIESQARRPSAAGARRGRSPRRNRDQAARAGRPEGPARQPVARAPGAREGTAAIATASKPRVRRLDAAATSSKARSPPRGACARPRRAESPISNRGRRRRVESLAAAQKDLARLAERGGWLPSAGPSRPGSERRDEVALLESRRDQLQKEAKDTHAQIARLESAIERLEKDLARSLELQDRKKTLDAQAALASTLAQHLRADQLLAFIQEEALRQLADDGSRRLEALSLGRYSLVVDDQEFAVVDHWNADSHRSVKTLSGGETFLASLALALALAEGLAGLASEGRAGDPAREPLPRRRLRHPRPRDPGPGRPGPRRAPRRPAHGGGRHPHPRARGPAPGAHRGEPWRRDGSDPRVLSADRP